MYEFKWQITALNIRTIFYELKPYDLLSLIVIIGVNTLSGKIIAKKHNNCLMIIKFF